MTRHNSACIFAVLLTVLDINPNNPIEEYCYNREIIRMQNRLVNIYWHAIFPSIISYSKTYLCLLVIIENLTHWDLVTPDNKVHGANMGPTLVLSTPDGPHVGPMKLAIWVVTPISQWAWSSWFRECLVGCLTTGHFLNQWLRILLPPRNIETNPI